MKIKQIRIFQLAVFTLVMVGIFHLVLPVWKTTTEESEFEKEENEEKPSQDLSPEEHQLYSQYFEKLSSKKLQLKSASVDDKSSYANGKVSGTWTQKIPHTTWNGYRVDNSAYDSLHNVFYVVSYAGHLYKLDFENGVNWTLLNNKVQMNPSNNDTANPIFLGVVIPDSTFRLIRSYDEMYRMEYSDDEGRTWKASTGARVTQSWSNQAFEIRYNEKQRLIVHTYDNGNHNIYFSDDFGANYKSSKFIFPISTYDVRIVKPYHTNEAFLWVWSKSTKKIDIYTLSNTGDFEKIISSTSTVAGTNLSSVDASYIDGVYHFYLSTINGDRTVYYSNDKGATWISKNAGRDKSFECMHPTKPNILFSGFEDMKMSTNYGATWTGFDHKLGWDMQHMRIFQKSNDKFITLVGLDFGCYVSETPEDKESYTWCNNGASYAMHYDAATSENFNSIYMGNQDRGTTAYLDSGSDVNTKDIDGTDVLRVCYGNHEQSVWTWFYYGRIKHRFNFPTGKSGEASYDGLDDWWAAPIIAAPNPSEDAIYLANGSNLQIFTFNPQSNSIVKTAHPFNFKTTFGGNLGGFGYSEIDRNLWYAALENGLFVYSTDAGVTWKRSNYTGTKPRANDQSYNYAKNQIAIKASATSTNKVYYAGVNNVFLISNDGGKTFTNHTRGLNVYRIRDFDVSPDDKFIYAACSFAGIWVYSVDDDYWYNMDGTAVPYVDFTDAQFIQGKNTVRFTSFGSGIMDFVLDANANTVNAPDALKAAALQGNKIVLSWTDMSDNETGFIIERADTGNFSNIDTVAANTTSYIDTTSNFNTTYYYKVKAFYLQNVPVKSNLARVDTPEKGYLSTSGWRVIYVDSEELNGEYAPGSNAIDNDINTFWHTQWQGSIPDFPHEIQVNMGYTTTVEGFRYLPRQDGSTNGGIANFEFYVSNDSLNWGEPAATGTFNTDNKWKEILFDQPVEGRYFRLVALSEIKGNKYTCVAGIAVLYEAQMPQQPSNLKASATGYESIRLSWTDNATNETGYYVQQLAGDEFVTVMTLNANATSYLHRNLNSSTTYTYRVVAFNKAGTSGFSNEAQARTMDKTGVPELNDTWKVSPNPFTDKLNIELQSGNAFSNVRIVDMKGNVCLSKEIKKGTTSLELQVADLPKGVYIMEMTDGNKRLNKKVTKR